jgi:CRISPR-associated endonuclease/helicase Cas3
VLTPAERDLTPAITSEGKGWQGPNGLGTVYRDLRMIEAAWRVLEDGGPWQIPADNRRLVEKATHPEVLQAIVEAGGDRWMAHQKHIMGQDYADRLMHDLASIDRSKPFGEELFGADIDQIKTRLGQNDYRVLLPEAVPGPFDVLIDELSVSAWQLNEPPDTEEVNEVSPFDGGFRFTFSGHAFRYDRFGLARM